jgi:putative transposase
LSTIRRLRLSDKIFFVACNLRTDRRRFDNEEFQLIIEAIDSTRGGLGYLFSGYVLMPDHWHALIATRHPLTISKIMETVKSKTSARLNKKRVTVGPNWQHQFWDRFVRDAKEFAQRLDYMHYNPVRRGLVRRPEQWRWSSCNNFSLDPALMSTCPIAINILHLPDSYRA